MWEDPEGEYWTSLCKTTARLEEQGWEHVPLSWGGSPKGGGWEEQPQDQPAWARIPAALWGVTSTSDVAPLGLSFLICETIMIMVSVSRVLVQL